MILVCVWGGGGVMSIFAVESINFVGMKFRGFLQRYIFVRYEQMILLLTIVISNWISVRILLTF